MLVTIISPNGQGFQYNITQLKKYVCIYHHESVNDKYPLRFSKNKEELQLDKCE